jgi:hypothetical protein
LVRGMECVTYFSGSRPIPLIHLPTSRAYWRVVIVHGQAPDCETSQRAMVGANSLISRQLLGWICRSMVTHEDRAHVRACERFRTPASSLAQPLSLAGIRNPSQKLNRRAIDARGALGNLQPVVDQIARPINCPPSPVTGTARWWHFNPGKGVASFWRTSNMSKPHPASGSPSDRAAAAV